MPINDPDEREAMGSANPFRLWALAQHPSAQVQELVAQNAHTPSNALVLLVGGGNPYVRETALSHPHITSEVMFRAWEVADMYAKVELLSFQGCPLELLTEALREHHPERVRWAAWQQIVDEPLGSSKFEAVMRPIWPDGDFLVVPHFWIGALFGF